MNTTTRRGGFAVVPPGARWYTGDPIGVQRNRRACLACRDAMGVGMW